MNSNQYQTVVLAALLHDIGKFIHRGKSYLRSNLPHPEAGQRFAQEIGPDFQDIADPSLFAELVFRHHDDVAAQAPPDIRPLAAIVSLADQLSASERNTDRSSRNYRTTPLCPIFSGLSASQSRARYTYPASQLTDFVNSPFPHQQQEYSLDRHIEAFLERFHEETKAARFCSFDSAVAFLLSVLHNYLWCVPSDTQTDFPDVSLFDHLSTSAAIAASLYLYHDGRGELGDIDRIRAQGEAKFALIAGDLSGIQHFILSASGKGASRQLRARSFYVSLLSEMVAHMILRRFQLPLPNLIMSAGGNFHILAPNLAGMEEGLQGIQAELDHWAISEFAGVLNVNLASVPFTEAAFADFRPVLQSAHNVLTLRKHRSLAQALADGSQWHEDSFLRPPIHAGDDGICTSCDRAPAEHTDGGQRLCSACRYFQELGSDLVKASFVALYDTPDGRYRILGSRSFSIVPKGGQIVGSPYLALSLDGPAPRRADHPTYFRYFCNHAPRATGEECHRCPRSESCQERPAEGSLLPFECIAQKSQGWDLLACIKADMDNLGTILGEGFQPPLFPTISRYAQFSRMLDLFFSGYVQRLLETRFPCVYTVFSGGDDLLLIGAWNEIIDFAPDLREAFAHFVADNPELHFSAGLSLGKAHTPVHQLVRDAEEAIAMAKAHPKNSITAFGHNISWTPRQDPGEAWKGDFAFFLREAKKLNAWITQGNLSVGFARRLLTYSIMFENSRAGTRTAYLRFLHLLTYDIKRNLSSDDPTVQQIRLWAETINKNLQNPLLHNLRAIVTYALLATRARETHTGSHSSSNPGAHHVSHTNDGDHSPRNGGAQ